MNRWKADVLASILFFRYRLVIFNNLCAALESLSNVLRLSLTCLTLPLSYMIFTTARTPLSPARLESSLRLSVISREASESIQ